ncbi:MAG: hypothetical protein WBX01_11930 [Nitrososphaeraceae archaeon]
MVVLIDNALLWNEQVQLKFRHLGSRVITRIGQENLDQCTKLMKFAELRHIDNVTGYLGIRDLDEQFIYVSTVVENLATEPIKVVNPEFDLILSTNQSFIQMQSYFFERVWSVAVPAMQKIAEIERVISRDKIIKETINNPLEIIDAITEVIQLSRSEILIVFPCVNIFWSAESAGIVASLGNKIKHNVVVKAVVHIDRGEGEPEIVKERIKQALRSKSNDLYASISFLTKDLGDRNMFLIVDQVTSLLIAIADSTKKAFAEVVGEMAVSNNESKITAAISVFDTLWIRSELEKHSHAKQAYFNIFKGFKLRQEEYRRKWLFEQKGARKPKKP